jgi:hypothetical protein
LKAALASSRSVRSLALTQCFKTSGSGRAGLVKERRRHLARAVVGGAERTSLRFSLKSGVGALACFERRLDHGGQQRRRGAVAVVEQSKHLARHAVGLAAALAAAGADAAAARENRLDFG